MHVYMIQNLVNGKCYIGQYAGENLSDYLSYNIRAALANRGNKLFLYRAIRKHGPENFVIHSLCNPISKEELDNYEIAYIKLFGTQNDKLGYNITGGGGGRLGTTSICSSETRLKMSLSRRGKSKSPEWIKKIGDSQRGRSLSPGAHCCFKTWTKGM